MVRVAFIAGNPETTALWDALRAELAKLGITDTHAIPRPGHDIQPVPEGFKATAQGYYEHLAEKLKELGKDGTPVHLVGHDWGAADVYQVVAQAPELVASWAADCAGIIHPDYVWHKAAQIYQAEPPEGEIYMKEHGAGAPYETRLKRLEGFNIKGEIAHNFADAMTDVMGECLLAAYRSVAQPKMIELGKACEAKTLKKPGLVIIPHEDHFTGTVEMAKEMAAKLNAKVAELPGLDHWWMLENRDPAAGARALAEFWKSL
ncbi:alpha/beta hydrolase fold protein [Hyaloraphidium curvatum]|nr:alpha/beta hydrolase fold protein [Hyaloraphidium curvatum]